MSNFVILKWQPFEGKKLKKLSIFGVVFTEIKNADILNFHESNSSVNISHFSQNDIYGSTIVEITGRRRQAFDCKLALQTVQDMVLDSYL